MLLSDDRIYAPLKARLLWLPGNFVATALSVYLRINQLLVLVNVHIAAALWGMDSVCRFMY